MSSTPRQQRLERDPRRDPPPSAVPRLHILLKLGRVSNLPTVITNALVGLALWTALPTGLAITLAMMLFYVAGMFLNDAFDHRYDARFAPDRPIPAGQIGVGEVVGIGGGMMLLALLLLVAVGTYRTHALLGGVALVTAIVLYDAWHKQNPLSPLLMASCRALVVISAALATAGTIDAPTWVAIAAISAHLIGLTYAAKQEHLRTPGHAWPLLFLLAPIVIAISHAELWLLPFIAALVVADVLALRRLRRRAPGDVPRAVALLIAAISLVDATSLAAQGRLTLALACVACFFATLYLQRWVRGT